MTNREKLIELLEQAESAVYWNSGDRNFIEKIADHLIANGAIIPARCRDCIHWDSDFDWCDRKRTRMFEGDFCSYGESKNDG